MQRPALIPYGQIAHNNHHRMKTISIIAMGDRLLALRVGASLSRRRQECGGGGGGGAQGSKWEFWRGVKTEMNLSTVVFDFQV